MTYAGGMRIGTWNILAGSTVRPGPSESLAEAVSAFDLDVLALNEVDLLQERSGRAHQARDAAVGMQAPHWRFGPSFRVDGAKRIQTPGTLYGPDDTPNAAHYGIALLSRIPVRAWHRVELGRSPIGLPLLDGRKGGRSWYYCEDEPHLGIAAELTNGWTVIATHLSFVTPIAIAQLSRLRRWAKQFGERTVILGDMNLARAVITLRPRWQSAVNTNTYPSWRPVVQLDHILIPRRAAHWPISLARPGLSDHLPIATELH